MIQTIKKILDILPYSFRSRIKNIPVLKQLQKLVQNKFLNNKEFIATISAGPAKGLVFPVQMPQDKGMWIGTWEIEFSEALSKEIEPNFVCYDIGSYKGYYGGVMGIKKAKKIYLFEPMPKNAKKIEELIQLNKNLPMQLVQKAMSNAVGEISFYIMPEDTMGKLAESEFETNNVGQQKINVQTTTLDNLVYNESFLKPNFLKIDVEGAEINVLEGAINVLNECRPILMIEVHSPEIGKKCLEILKPIYSNIYVLENGKYPFTAPQPEICHFVVKA